MRYLVAVDSFKECMSSQEAGYTLAKALNNSHFIPVSDGGEGFASCLASAIDADREEIIIHGPLGDLVNVTYYLKGRTAVLDTATASGLGLVPPQKRNPLHASSFGTGEIISDAINKGARDIFIGLGGSATVDAGLGMLQALGYKIITPKGAVFAPVMSNIVALDSSDADKALLQCNFHAFYDVDVPLYGWGGAAQMFAPQKGAGKELTLALDKWLSQVASVFENYSGRAAAFSPGSGAAGGIGAALEAILHGQLKSGIEEYLELINFKQYITDSEDFAVITGEGSADIQTLSGKVPYGILQYVRRYAPKAKVILVAGKVQDYEAFIAAGFDAVYKITPDGMPLEEALSKETATMNLQRTAREIITDCHIHR